MPSPGDLPDPGIEPWSPALQMDSLPAELPGKLFVRPQFLHIESETVSIVWQSLFKLWTFIVNVVLRKSSGKVFYKFKTKSREITTSIFNKYESNTHVSLLINTYFFAQMFLYLRINRKKPYVKTEPAEGV